MDKKKTRTGSPLIYTYLKKFQEDPKSRVFAPLAEAYRKAGLVDEAIDICQEGLKVHPEFIGGSVALARALFDKQLYDQVIQTLENVIINAPDNLVAQRLYADSNLMVGNVIQALSSYKMLLFLRPDDQETSKLVHELEVKAYESGVIQLGSREVSSMEVRQAAHAFDESPEAKQGKWRNKITMLQDLLKSVEHYRVVVSN